MENSSPSRRPLKIGLIGFGRISQIFHLKILQSLPGAELVALAEADAQRLETARKQLPGLEFFSDYQDLIRRSAAEAVVICLPSGMHAGAGTFALQNNKHLYLEKPLATTMAEAEELLALQKTRKKVAMIGFNFRFHRLFQQLKKELSTGKIGKIIGVRTVLSSPRRNLPEWKKKRESGGGVLLDLASHHIDLVHFLFEQKITGVAAAIRSIHSEQDAAHLQLQLENGITVQSFLSCTSVEEDRIEVYGEKGKLTADRMISDEVVFSGPGLSMIRFKKLAQNMRAILHSPLLLGRFRTDANFGSFHSALNHFVRCISSGQTASPDLEDGFRSLEVILQAESSLNRYGSIVIP